MTETGNRSRVWLMLFWGLLTTALKSQDGEPSYVHYTVADGLPSNTVYHVSQDSSGFVWFGTDAGAVRFDGEQFTVFTTEDGLPDNEVLKIFHDSKGRTWFLTFNGKFGYYHRGVFHNQGNDKVLAKVKNESPLFSFYEDHRGVLWFGSNQITKIDGEEVWSSKIFSEPIPYLGEEIDGRAVYYSNMPSDTLYGISAGIQQRRLEPSICRNPGHLKGDICVRHLPVIMFFWSAQWRRTAHGRPSRLA